MTETPRRRRTSRRQKRKARNRRILIGFGAVSAVAVIAIAAYIGVKLADNPERRFAQHAQDARSYAEAGKYRAAVIEYKNAIRIHPDDADLRWELGQLYMAQGDPAAAYKEMTRAQDLGLRNAEVTRAILEATARKGDFDGTLAALQDMRDSEDGALADAPDMLTLEGTAQLALGNLEAAEKALVCKLCRLRDFHSAVVSPFESPKIET